MVFHNPPEPAAVALDDEFSPGFIPYLLTLGPQFLQALTLVVVRGRSYERAAEIMGERQGTIKSRVFRARETLRALSAERPPFEPRPPALIKHWQRPDAAPKEDSGIFENEHLYGLSTLYQIATGELKDDAERARIMRGLLRGTSKQVRYK